VYILLGVTASSPGHSILRRARNGPDLSGVSIRFDRIPQSPSQVRRNGAVRCSENRATSFPLIRPIVARGAASSRLDNLVARLRDCRREPYSCRGSPRGVMSRAFSSVRPPSVTGSSPRLPHRHSRLYGGLGDGL
jgi:hypothetical protein